MSAAMLALGWSVVLVWGAGWARPAPRRVRALVAHGMHQRRQGVSPAAPSALRRPELVQRLGECVLRRAGRTPTASTSRRLGLALSVAVPLVIVQPLAAPPAALVAWMVPGLRERRAERRRLAALASELPDVVDLLVLAVGAGLNVHLALASVSRRAPGALAGELARVCREAALGRRLADALDDLPTRAGEATRPLAAALSASERYGAPLSTGLERLSDDVRRQRRRRAEEAAAKVPVKLLFPLVTCTLPAFGLLTVVPVVASALRALRL